MTPNSLGQVLLNKAMQDPEQRKALEGVVHRTQLWSYRTGKTKPAADNASAIELACPAIAAGAWGQPAPEAQVGNSISEAS